MEKEELNVVTSEEESEEIVTEAEPVDEKREPEKKKKKKGPFIQVSVLISLGIVVLALVGYYVYSNYFLHLPQGIIWEQEKDGVIHYYEFTDDNMFSETWSTKEVHVSYEELTEGGTDIIRLYYPDGYEDYQLSMTGSRLKKNQTLTLTDAEGEVFIDCREVEEKKSDLVLPTEVQLDPKLTGDWECQFINGVTERLSFNSSGLLQDSATYRYDGHTYIKTLNMTYTVLNDSVFYTLVKETEDADTGKKKFESINDNTEYLIENDYLLIFGNVYKRVSEPATPSEA